MLCKFHRKQDWNRWLSASKNKLEVTDCTLDNKAVQNKCKALLETIAESRTEEMYEKNLNLVRDNPLWQQNVKLQKYITNTWLPEHKVVCTTNISTY